MRFRLIWIKFGTGDVHKILFNGWEFGENLRIGSDALLRGVIWFLSDLVEIRYATSKHSIHACLTFVRIADRKAVAFVIDVNEITLTRVPCSAATFWPWRTPRWSPWASQNTWFAVSLLILGHFTDSGTENMCMTLIWKGGPCVVRLLYRYNFAF
jgi:hypothetical protein